MVERCPDKTEVVSPILTARTKYTVATIIYCVKLFGMIENKISKKLKHSLRMLNERTDEALQKELYSKNRRDLMDRNRFDYYDSEASSYEWDFKNLLTPYSTFNEYIKSVYSERLGSLVGVEFGGPGIEFFKSIEENVFKKTAGFTLRSLPEHENTSKHEIIDADVFSKITNRNIFERSWANVEEWIKENGKPDFIVERMVGPLMGIRSPQVFLLIFDRWYGILNDEGSMFIEIPKNLVVGRQDFDYHSLRLLLDEVKMRNPGLEIKYDIYGDATGAVVIYLKKKVGAPKSLRGFA